MTAIILQMMLKNPRWEYQQNGCFISFDLEPYDVGNTHCAMLFKIVSGEACVSPGLVMSDMRATKYGIPESQHFKHHLKCVWKRSAGQLYRGSLPICLGNHG